MNQICQNEDKMPMFLLELPCQTQFYCSRHNIKSNTRLMYRKYEKELTPLK